ncbi:MAG TPA: hypothetical protein VJH24_02405, partial [Candidatus Bilamarchaeaceae archaeon]|nr:hypothetical protein [Candidatus Bilamarchaeaceae archaeon]
MQKNLELGKYFTFEPSKDKPIYNWFYYKEAFSPEIVEWALNEEQVRQGTLVDPFCGIGTALLTAKSKGLPSMGSDISPLTVLVSEVKSQDYPSREQEEIRGFPDTAFNGPASTAKWEFELFSPRAVFPPSNLHKLLQLRVAIANVQNVKVQH